MDSGNDIVAKVLSYFLHKVLMVSGQSGQGMPHNPPSTAGEIG